MVHELPFFLGMLTKEDIAADTMRAIFLDNFELCSHVNKNTVDAVLAAIELNGRRVRYLQFLMTLVKADGQTVRRSVDWGKRKKKNKEEEEEGEEEEEKEEGGGGGERERERERGRGR